MMGFMGGESTAPAGDPMDFMAAAPGEGEEELSAGGKFRAAVHAVNFAVGQQSSQEDPFSGMPMGNDGMGQTMQIPEVTKLREWETKHEEELEATARKEEAAKRQTRESAAE